MAFSRTLRDELELSASQITLLRHDHRGLKGEEVVRRIRFGLIEVPSWEEAGEELKRRRKQEAVEKRRRTIARRKAAGYYDKGKVVPFKRGGE